MSQTEILVEFYNEMKQNLIYIVENQQYAKVKNIYEIFFKKIKRVKFSDLDTEDKINGFFIDFRDNFITLFETKFNSKAKLNTWFEYCQKKNNILDVIDKGRLAYFKEKFLDSWELIVVPKAEAQTPEYGQIGIPSSATPGSTPTPTDAVSSIAPAQSSANVVLPPNFMQQMKDAFLHHIDERFDEMGGKLDDISVTIDDIKTDTELIRYIKEETSLIGDIKDDTDAIMQAVAHMEEHLDEKMDSIDRYLRTKLGNTQQKIAQHWKNYKDGKITKRAFIFKALKVGGKRILKFF